MVVWPSRCRGHPLPRDVEAGLWRPPLQGHGPGKRLASGKGSWLMPCLWRRAGLWRRPEQTPDWANELAFRSPACFFCLMKEGNPTSGKTQSDHGAGLGPRPRSLARLTWGRRWGHEVSEAQSASATRRLVGECSPQGATAKQGPEEVQCGVQNKSLEPARRV